MLFRQVLNADLGCASYFVASRRTGTAAVIDPQYDIAPYVALATRYRVRITHVLETHNHADHISGRNELVAATGATVIVPAGSPGPHDAQRMTHDERLELGPDATMQLINLSGHRPEQAGFLLFDPMRDPVVPWGVVTGDSLLVGDVARPDLAVDGAEGAALLWEAMERLRELPDHVEVWPGHIAGSLCGTSAISDKPSSTIGFERRNNHLFALADREAFIRELNAELPPRPVNVERIVATNADGSAPVPGELSALSPGDVATALEGGAWLVDTRTFDDYARAHVAGSVYVDGTRTGFASLAAQAVPFGAPIILVTPGKTEATRLRATLGSTSLFTIAGWLDGGVEAWQQAGMPVADLKVVAAADVDPALFADALPVDVRSADEYSAFHVEGSRNVPIPEMHSAEDWSTIDSPIVVYCASGRRATTAASVIAALGGRDVTAIVSGGVVELKARGVAVTGSGHISHGALAAAAHAD